MKIFITGITSIHGWPIYKKLRQILSSEQIFGLRPPKMSIPNDPNVIAGCITDRGLLYQIKKEFQPTHVVHCAGVCDLDVCEARPHWAAAINIQGCKNIKEIFGDTCTIHYMSTDLVFSGNNPPHQGYAEKHIPDPVSVAGKTFKKAEQQIKESKQYSIVRLGLPLGDSVNGKKGAIDWIRSRFTKNRPVTLFFDEFRSCLWCDEIGEMSIQLLERQIEGVYHFGGTKKWSLHEIGQYVIQTENYSPHLLKGINRHEEENGPPRIGDVSLNSSKLKQLLKI